MSKLFGKYCIFVNWKIFTAEEEQIIEPPKSNFELWKYFMKYSLLVRMGRVKWLELSICQHSYNYTKHRLALKLHHTNSFKIMIPNQALKPWNCARFWRSCSKVSFPKKIVAVLLRSFSVNGSSDHPECNFPRKISGTTEEAKPN